MITNRLRTSLLLRCPPAVLILAFAAVCVGCSKEKPPSHEDIIRGDFEEILDLNEQKCDGIVSFEKISDLEYLVACGNGESYRIHVSHEGHVNVAPHDP